MPIEIRDPSLHDVLARGAIAPSDGTNQLTWRTVTLSRTKLHAGKRYAIVVYSTGTHYDAPWAVNAIYQDVYAPGHHYGYADDLLFALEFRDGDNLRVGPDDKAHRAPINGGATGGHAMPGPPTIYAPGPIGAGAERDPFGVLPGFDSAQLAR